MITLSLMRFVGPAHLLLPLFLVLLIVGIAAGLFFLGRASASGPKSAGSGPLSPTDADLERRRKSLELDRMAIENEERRRKLNQQG